MTGSTTAPQSEPPRSIADLSVQHPAAPATAAEARGRFFNSGNAFNLSLPPVPSQSFTAEPLRAFDPATPTGLIPCDNSAALNCAFAATTPLVLAYYAKIRAGETLSTGFVASGVVAYVVKGGGFTHCAEETVTWQAGDLLILPGGEPVTFIAGEADCVLWVVTNEPQLAFEHLQAPASGHAPTRLVHYRADKIMQQIELLYTVEGDEMIPGSALVFSAEQQESTRNILPTLTVAMNTLPAGSVQRPHSHNSVAVMLIVSGEGCFSRIDGERKDWLPWATTVTPPGAIHSHHNDGAERALFLIVQDGGLFYHMRAMGFAFAEQPA